jgi:hypothetical protein
MFADKETFFRFGGFDESRLTGADIALTATLQKKGKFKFMDEAYIITSMRRFEKKGYALANLADLIRGLFPDKIGREWVR